MESRTCGGDSGTRWLAEGWRLFMASPGLWMVLSIVLFLVLIALNLVPLVGMLAAQLLSPALAGGMLLAARDAEAGRPLDLGRLFEPLVSGQSRGDILILGLLYVGVSIAAMVLVAILAMVTVGLSALQSGVPNGAGSMDPAMAASMGLGALFAVLIGLLLMLALTALLFYAIPLVVLSAVPPIQAVGEGLRGLLRNWLPLLVLGLIWTVLAIVASIPLLLGWLVLAPVTWGAWYASYRDIFVSTEAPSARVAAAGTDRG